MKATRENMQEPQKEKVQHIEKESSTGGEAMISDNRPAIAAQRKIRSVIGGTRDTNNAIQQERNNTGLPNKLKAGIENLSGYSMDDVKVHYNSSKPAQLQAHAYAQGTDIHLGPGQEKHLAHEAWHVVQQKQGRVKPTLQFKGKVGINDDAGLEKEANVMGRKAKNTDNRNIGKLHNYTGLYSLNTIQRKEIDCSRLNLIGEDHDESGGDNRKPEETVVKNAYLSKLNKNELQKVEKILAFEYWQEQEFMFGEDEERIFGDPLEYKVIHVFTFAFMSMREKQILLSIAKNAKKNQEVKENLINNTAQTSVFESGMSKGGIDREWISDIAKNKMPELEKNIQGMYKLLRLWKKPNLKTDDFIKNWKKEPAEKLHAFLETLWNILVKLGTIVQDDKDTILMQEIELFEKNFCEMEGEFKTYMGEHFDIKNIYEKREQDEINVVDTTLNKHRSLHMHQIANKAVDQNMKGVWKVGDKHVDDIKDEFNEGERNYELITREEFYNQYGEEIEKEKVSNGISDISDLV